MWCWRRVERMSGTDRVRNEEVLQSGKEKKNKLQTIKKEEGKWSGHILRSNCLLKHVIEGKIEGKIEVTGRRGTRRWIYWMALRIRTVSENFGTLALQEATMDLS
jgi:hypothetical protein